MSQSSNKTVATFSYKGRRYEIDWLTDIDHGDGYRMYHVFEGKGSGARCVVEFGAKDQAKQLLIRYAKQELENKLITV